MSKKGAIILEISLKHEVDSKFLANFYNSILDQIDDIYTEINIFNEQKKQSKILNFLSFSLVCRNQLYSTHNKSIVIFKLNATRLTQRQISMRRYNR